MIRSKTKLGYIKWLNELRQLENIIPDPKNPAPYRVAYGNYPIWEHKEWYCNALSAYLYGKIKEEEAFSYITKISQKIAYLEKKLRELHPNYRLILSPEILISRLG